MVLKELTDEELNMIYSYRVAFTDNEEGILKNRNFADSRYILREWNQQKKILFNLLGKKLMIQRTLEYKKSFDDLSEEMNDLAYNTYGRANRDAWTFIENYRRILINDLFPYMYYDRCMTDEGMKYVNQNNDIHYKLLDLICSYNLALNKYEGKTFFIPYGDKGKTLKVPNGCKISRILGKIAGIFNIEGYEDFRICHSQILNQKTISGELVLSIHPMDYMTMSDNTCGWESCMNWMEGGSYRQGTVEMMNSPSVLVAYLASDTDMAVPGGYDWTNKKWRQLFVVDERGIASVKAYPYYNEDLTKIILKWLKDLAEENLGWEFQDKVFEYNGKERIQYSEKKPAVEINFSTEYMYNDFGTTKHYLYLKPDYKDSELSFMKNSLWIPYSGRSECMICGDLDIEIENESYLGCSKCQDCGTYCEMCENRVYSDEIYEVDDQILCEDCFYEYTQECCITGERHLIDNMQEIYIISKVPEVKIEELKKTHPFINTEEGSLYAGTSYPQFYLSTSFEDFQKEFLKKGSFISKYERPYYGFTYGISFNDLNEKGLQRMENFPYLGEEDFIENLDHCYNIFPVSTITNL